MKMSRVLSSCVAIALASSAIAHAETRMVVLIDASGSMSTLRSDGLDRFTAAKTLSEDRILEQAAVDSNIKVAVYTFHQATTLIPHTAGFVTASLALDAIDGLTTAANVSGSTPLAGAMCGSANQLNDPLADIDVKIIQVSSDGLENSTPTADPCAGFTGTFPYPAGSWQKNVLDYFAAISPAPPIVSVDLFDASQISLTSDPEGLLTKEQMSANTTPSIAGLTPLEQFFTVLTQATGGHLTIVSDDRPLPVVRPPPTLNLPASVVAEANSTAGAIVTYQATATDVFDGALAVTCAPASGSQFAVGTTTVHCSTQNSRGLVTQGSFPVTVSYGWGDVASPLNSGGGNQFNSGRTVPVKFALTGASAGITNLVATLYVASMSGGVIGPEAPASSAGGGSGQFRYNAATQQYIFNWSTKGLAAGLYRLRIDLGDGKSHTIVVELN